MKDKIREQNTTIRMNIKANERIERKIRKDERSKTASAILKKIEPFIESNIEAMPRDLSHLCEVEWEEIKKEIQKMV